MTITSRNHALYAVTAALFCALTLGAPGQSNPTKTPAKKSPAASQAEQPARKQTAGPFHGRLKAIDRTAGTIAMGTRTFQITEKTKITKDGKPATMAEGVVGEIVSGYFKTAEDGKLVLSSLRFGPKTETENSSVGKSTKPSAAKE